jgi:hypothetical protein
MDELINQVTQRAGISSDQAQKAVQTVVGFLKDRLPGPVAAQLDGVIGGQSAGGLGGQAQQAMGNIGGSLGGMLGGNNQPNPGS